MSAQIDSVSAHHALLLKQAAEQRESYKIAQKAKSHTRAQRALEQAQKLEAEAHAVAMQLAEERRQAEMLRLPDMTDDELIGRMADGMADLPSPLVESILIALIERVGDGPLRRALAPPLRLVGRDE
jgi:hypothetical protein